MQSVMCNASDTIKPNQIQLRSGLPVSNASCSISSMSSKSEILVVTLFIRQLNTATIGKLSHFVWRAIEVNSPTSSLRQRARTRSFNEGPCRPANLIRDAGLRGHKFRREPRKQTDQVVCHQNLAVTLFAGTDADGGNINRVCNLFRDLGHYNLKHN